MQSLIERHLQSLEATHSKTTVAIASKWLSQLDEFTESELTELGTRDLNDWHRQLTWSPGPSGKLYSQNTVNQAVGAVRRFYRWALAEGLVDSDPAVEIITRAARNTRSSKLDLGVSQVRKLLGSLDLSRPTGLRDRAVLGILLETRISRPACSRIDLAHLQPDTGALMSTGRGQRIHCLSEGLLADLARYLEEARPLLASEPCPALFLNTQGNRLTAASIQQMVRYYRQRCGL